jgi:hypothetical protein
LESREPEVLDLGLMVDMISEEIAEDAHLVVGYGEVLPKKACEKTRTSGSALMTFNEFRAFAPSAQYNMQPAAYEASRSCASLRPSS